MHPLGNIPPKRKTDIVNPYVEILKSFNFYCVLTADFLQNVHTNILEMWWILSAVNLWSHDN